MTDTIKDKIQHSTTLMFRETLGVMVQFGIITEKQKEFLNRVCDDFKYGKKVLNYDSIDHFFRYDKEMFDKKLLDLVKNPKPHTT